MFGFVMAYVWFKISDLITPIRVSKEVEMEGLDGPEMGVLGYPDFQLTVGSIDELLSGLVTIQRGSALILPRLRKAN